MLNLFGYNIHPHGATVHFPIALYFTAALFFTLGLFYPQQYFEVSSYYLLVTAAPLTPVAYATGIYYWRTKYKGYRTPLFDKKLILGAILWVLGLGLMLARGMNPSLAYPSGVGYWLYMGGIYLAGVLPMPLGYLGGKLVFKE